MTVCNVQILVQVDPSIATKSKYIGENCSRGFDQVYSNHHIKHMY